MPESAQTHRAPHGIQDRHNDQHIEKVKITDRGQKHHKDEQPRLFPAEISLASDQDQRKEDKWIQEIVMTHSRHGKPVEDVNQGTRKHSQPGPPPHIECICTESNARQPEADHEHQIMKMHQILFGNKNSRQAEGISDHIIGKGRKKILSVSHAEAESRETEYMSLLKLPDHFLSPARKIKQPVIMLAHSVRLPDKALPFQPEPHKYGSCRSCEQNRISQKIYDIVPDPQGLFLCAHVFTCSLHFSSSVEPASPTRTRQLFKLHRAKPVTSVTG